MERDGRHVLEALFLASALSAVACVQPPDGTIAHFPEPTELPDREALPDLFRSFDGKAVATTPQAFTTWRRQELLALFDHYQYGTRPPMVDVVATRTARLDSVVPGAIWDEYELVLGGRPDAVLHVAFLHPYSMERPPVILAINKCGNQSLVAAQRVRETTAPSACDAASLARGGQASAWPLEEIVARGYAVATFHDGDAAPDDVRLSGDALRSQFPVDTDEDSSWGAISIWAWALAHTARWLETADVVNPERITVFGHSRRGKAALLAGAIAPEIDAVIAHQSGTAGAALHRHLEGETLDLITQVFPYWFAPRFREFAGRELATPVDQHQLLALLAPRRVVLVDGDEDAWADPSGARAAAEAASPAWKLFGKTGFGKELTWQTRPGGHAVESSDWQLFLDALEAN